MQLQIIKAKDLNEGDTFKTGIKSGNTHWAEKVSIDGDQVPSPPGPERY